MYGERELLEWICGEHKLDYVSQLKPALDALIERKRVVLDEQKYVYLTALHSAETTIASYAMEHHPTPEDDDVPFEMSTSDGGCPQCRNYHWRMEMYSEEFELDCSQTLAAQRMISERTRIAITTGGPGTGKTSVLRAALDALDEVGASYVLAAPTGKAAKRMSKATSRDAVTLHSLFKIRPSDAWFYGTGVSEGPRTEARFVFIDEASMIDAMLMAQVIKRLGHARLRLIGDVNQLPPVGAGQPFSDLIKSGHIPVTRLTQLHRSAADSWIAVNAPVILAGHMPALAFKPRERAPGEPPPPEQEEDFMLIECRNASAIPGALRDLFVRDETSWITKVSVAALSPQHKGPAGVIALNAVLHDTLNPINPEAPARVEISAHAELRLRSKVMIRHNDSSRGLVNGDTGRVVHIETNDKDEVTELFVGEIDGDNERKVHSYSVLQAKKDLELAYCFTVHKAQGSEYDWVIVVCHHSHHMTTRRLFYTAVTRAKKGVILIGTTDAVRQAIANTADKQRFTRLVDRMNVKQLELELATEAAHGRLH
jgi:exodeoxyribonuclease V alpha subunit